MVVSLGSLKSLGKRTKKDFIAYALNSLSFIFNPAMRAFPPSHLGNSYTFDCSRFGVGSSLLFHLLSFIFHLALFLPLSVWQGRIKVTNSFIF